MYSYFQLALYDWIIAWLLANKFHKNRLFCQKYHSPLIGIWKPIHFKTKKKNKQNIYVYLQQNYIFLNITNSIALHDFKIKFSQSSST